MDGWLHGFANNGPSDWAFSKFIKYSDLNNPGPASVFVFADEHENSINDGNIAVARRGWNVWVDTPADRHGQAANFSYAGGNVERQGWKWPKRCRGEEDHFYPFKNDLDLKDLLTLQAHIPQ